VAVFDSRARSLGKPTGIHKGEARIEDYKVITRMREELARKDVDCSTKVIEKAILYPLDLERNIDVSQ
jgi:hypothetical protein